MNTRARVAEIGALDVFCLYSKNIIVYKYLMIYPQQNQKSNKNVEILGRRHN